MSIGQIEDSPTFASLSFSPQRSPILRPLARWPSDICIHGVWWAFLDTYRTFLRRAKSGSSGNLRTIWEWKHDRAQLARARRRILIRLFVLTEVRLQHEF